MQLLGLGGKVSIWGQSAPCKGAALDGFSLYVELGPVSALWQHPWKSILCHRNLLEFFFPAGMGFCPSAGKGERHQEKEQRDPGSGTLPRYRELFLAFPAPFLTFPVPSSQAPDDPAGACAAACWGTG